MRYCTGSARLRKLVPLALQSNPGSPDHLRSSGGIGLDVARGFTRRHADGLDALPEKGLSRFRPLNRVAGRLMSLLDACALSVL